MPSRGIRSTLDRRGRSASLVVLVSGATLDARSLAGVREVVETERPDADILTVDYGGPWWSNEDPFILADQLERSIDEAVATRPDPGPYSVVLVGHSAGALLARKAYVYAAGYTEDHPFLPRRIRFDERPRPSASGWASMVERVILFAGINRGWSLAARPAAMPRWRYALLRAAYPPLRLLGVGGLLRALERGAPFVANLRVQWLWSARDGLAPPTPAVTQFLGDRDDVVSQEDDMDLATTLPEDGRGPRFEFVPLLRTDHRSIVDFAGPDGAARRRLFREHLVRELPRSERAVLPTGAEPRRVVFVMHGIRDRGDWRTRLRDEIARRDPSVAVRIPGYGYLPMLPFLLAMTRQKYVRWFMDEYTELLAESPAEVHVSYVGHSNGTYILACALAQYATLHVDRVVFAGSVVPSDYDWDRLADERRVRGFRNLRASADWVVGIFPRLFEFLRERFGARFGSCRDLGAGGLNGFQSEFCRANDLAYLRGGHSAAITLPTEPTIADFVLGGAVTHLPAALVAARPHPLVTVGSRLCWPVWGAIVSLLALPLLALRSWAAADPASFAAAHAPALGGAYLVLVLLLLLSV